MGQEIERKWQLIGRPTIPREAEEWGVDQGYLERGEIEVRVRRIVRSADPPRFVKTTKQGSGLQRSESEEEISQQAFEELWPRTMGARVSKRRYRIAAGDLIWELDVFLDRDLVLLEVELERAEQEVFPPPWAAPLIAKEVTEDPQFKNQNLAR